MSKVKDRTSDDPLRAYRNQNATPSRPAGSSRWLRFRKWLSGVSDSRIEKQSLRGPVASYVYQTEPMVRYPTWDYSKLIQIASTSWVMRQIVRAIIQEVVGRGWVVRAKFSRKCVDCGNEMQGSERQCSFCGSTNLRQPSQHERRKFESFLARPNPDYNMDSLLRALLFYTITVEDGYLSLAYGDEEGPDGTKVSRVKEVYVEDSRYIFPVADQMGHLGNNEFFCPQCYDPSTDSPVVTVDSPTDTNSLVCPRCGGQLRRTCYEMIVMGSVRARFGEDEIIHISPSRLLPELFGNPKLISVVKLVETLSQMDDYNWEIYKGGSLGGIISFPGMQQDEVTAMKTSVQAEVEKLDKRDMVTGAYSSSRKIRSLWLGVSNPPEYLRVMEDPRTMQSLDFWKAYREVVCSVYGVTPVFVSILESGKAGTAPRMQIDVQNRVTLEHQKFIEDAINFQLLPKMGINDWVFYFETIELKDELREAQINQIKASTALTWLNGGFDVELNDDGDIVVSGVGARPQSDVPIPAPTPPLPTEPLPGIRESESTGALSGEAKAVAESDVSESDVSEEAREIGEAKPRVRIKGVSTGLQDDLNEVMDWLRAHKGEKNAVQRAMSRAEAVLDKHFDAVIKITLNEIESKTGVKVDSLPPEVDREYKRQKQAALHDYRIMLRDEMRRG